MSEFDKLKEKINAAFKPSKGSEISEAVLFDQRMQHALDQIINLRQYLQMALQTYKINVPKEVEDIPDNAPDGLRKIVQQPQYRLFEVLGRINPYLKFHVIDDVKYANLVMDCAKDLPILKDLIFQITPEINTS
jgi:hypothetical protein